MGKAWESALGKSESGAEGVSALLMMAEVVANDQRLETSTSRRAG